MDIIFTAELHNIKIMYNFLKAISFKDTAVISLTERGMKITVEEMKCVQTSAYIPNDVFDVYKLQIDEEEINFKISMKILTEFLNIFGDDGSPSLKIVYKEIGSPLMLILDHSEECYIADCKLETIEEDEVLNLYLATECRVNNVVVKAPLLVNIIHELDMTADHLILFLSPDPPHFRISTEGMLGEIHVDISPNSDMVELFRCTKTTKLAYNSTYIKQLEKVMNISSRISISTGDEAGLLGLQMIIESNEQSSKEYKMFVEYFCTALTTGDEDEDNRLGN